MKTSVVLTLIGPDRPGLVSAVAARAGAVGASWMESRLAQLAGAEVQPGQQVAQLRGAQRRFEVAHHGGGQAAGFEEFERTAGFRAARVVIKRQIGHVRVASCVRWRLFYLPDGRA